MKNENGWGPKASGGELARRGSTGAGATKGTDSVALIEALYTLSDITSEINGHAPQAPMGLTEPDDIGLIDDVIDALQDRRHGEFARASLRDALARFARHVLEREGEKR